MPQWGEGALSTIFGFPWQRQIRAWTARISGWRGLCTARAMISTTIRGRWTSARGVIALMALGTLLAACEKHGSVIGENKVAVGEDKNRSQPAGSAMPASDGVDAKGLTPRSDQKMVPGLDQGHTPGPADTTVPLQPGVPPLDKSGAAANPPVPPPKPAP